MRFTVCVIHGDGARYEHAAYDDLSVAAGAAFQLADDLGRTPLLADNAAPIKASVYRGDDLEIAVHIVRGGLHRVARSAIR